MVNGAGQKAAMRLGVTTDCELRLIGWLITGRTESARYRTQSLDLRGQKIDDRRSKNEPSGLKMNSDVHSICNDGWLFSAKKRCVTPSALRRNSANHLYWNRVLRDLARILMTEIAKVSAPKNKKNAPAEESANQRPKRKKQKLIRLDDLIPKRDVTGGRQHLFGVTDTIQTNEKGK